MTDLEILEKLFTCKSEEIEDILKLKINWIDNVFYIGGFESDLNDDVVSKLEKGNLIFKRIEIYDEHLSQEKQEYYSSLCEDFAVIDLSSNRDYDCDFFIEYDFNKLEKSMHQDLYPNFYHKLAFEDLHIKENSEASILDIFKCLIIGNINESRIIMSKDRLDNMCYYCPVISKIYYRKNIKDDSLIKLSRIAHLNHAEIEEINEN